MLDRFRSLERNVNLNNNDEMMMMNSLKPAKKLFKTACVFFSQANKFAITRVCNYSSLQLLARVRRTLNILKLLLVVNRFTTENDFRANRPIKTQYSDNSLIPVGSIDGVVVGSIRSSSSDQEIL